MIINGILYVNVIATLAIISCLIGVYSRGKRKEKAQNEFLASIIPSLGIEQNLAIVLSEMQKFVEAPSFRFYMYQSSQDNYVLKSVRQVINDTAIKPAYSGLLPYEKQNSSSPLVFSKESYPSKTIVVREGELSKIWMPINDGIGFILIGPIKKYEKKVIKVLDEYSSLLAGPLQELVGEVEENSVRRIDRKNRMLAAKNYALYYGYGKGEELSCFDLIIVEPKGFSLPEFKKLREANKVLFTYLSLIEVHPTDSIFEQLTEEDLLIVDGKPMRNEAFGTYLVNLQSKKWIDYLLKKVSHHIEVLKVDGLFLDTIGDIEFTSIPLSEKNVQLKAVINFLHIFKMLYPTHLLIQNNGLEAVCLETAPYIDGICWENPPLSSPVNKDWTDQILQRLSLLKEEFQLTIFLLVEMTWNQEKEAYLAAKKVAKEKDYLLYLAPKNYIEGVNNIPSSEVEAIR